MAFIVKGKAHQRPVFSILIVTRNIMTSFGWPYLKQWCHRLGVIPLSLHQIGGLMEQHGEVRWLARGKVMAPVHVCYGTK